MKFVILSLLFSLSLSFTPKHQNHIKSEHQTAPPLFNRIPIKTCDNDSPIFTPQVTQFYQEISAFNILPYQKQSTAEFSGVGLDLSAYFFDYLDSAISLHIINEFNHAWYDAKKENIFPEDVYNDRYSLSDNNLIVNKTEFENSITTKTIFALIQNKKINIESLRLSSSSSDVPLSIVREYDFNGDGRLNAKEYLNLIIDISVAVIVTALLLRDNIRDCTNLSKFLNKI